MILSLSLILYFLLFLIHKKIGFIYYQVFVTTVYLFSLSYIQTLDFTMSIYLLFSVLPYLSSIKFNSILSFILLIYFSINIILGIIFNGVSSISVFIIRLSGLLLFYLIFSKLDFSLDINKKDLYQLIAILSCELLIFIIGATLSDNDRLMLNYQCTVGCIATATILLLSYYLFYSTLSRKLILVSMIVLTIIACLSKTRGYILVTVAVTGVSIFLFLGIQWRIIFILLLSCIILFSYDAIIDFFMIDLRMGESTGIRTSENLFVLKFMNKRPLINLLFGNTFGAFVGQFPESESIISSVSYSSYTHYALYHRNSFHNFWATIYYSCGLIGVIIVCALYIFLIKKIINSNSNYKFKIVMLTYILTYAVLLWYRWTATSGILEFAIFAYVLYRVNNKKCVEING